jgi:cobalt/nickel transport system permease protein
MARAISVTPTTFTIASSRSSPGCAADCSLVAGCAADHLHLRPGRNKDAEPRRNEVPLHIPDGFIDGGTSLAAGAVAAGGVAVCLRQAAKTLDDRQIPLAGMAAAFIFAVQMLNFPVASGTSGHLMGGALAAVLVGPWAGGLCVSVVLVVQSLLFADGGLSALGLNIVNMALVGAFGSYVVFLALRAVLPKTRPAVVGAAGVAALLGPVLAAIVFTIEYTIGGNDAASIGRVAGAMIGVHVLIGIGEGVITAMTISSVLAARPDLVHGARDLFGRDGAPSSLRPAWG